MKAEDKNMELQILQAASELFMKQGFTKTTTGQIAELAGCNQALVHYYYRTKENLFDKIFEEKIRLVTDNILAMNATGIVIEEMVIEIIEMHFNFLNQNPKLISFMLNEVSSDSDRLQALVTKLMQYPQSVLPKIDENLKNRIAQGTINPISATDLLFTIASLDVTAFLLIPLLQKLLKLSEQKIQEYLKNRKEEIKNTILIRLRI